MRRAIFAVIVTTVGLVLLLLFKPHEITAATDRPAAVSNGGSGDNSQDVSGGQATASPGSWSGSGESAGATSGDKVVTGGAADTRWGPVQVQLVISAGKITGVQVLRAPDGNHKDIEINNQALPILNEETLSAQSAQIDAVSGATYTSDGYVRSLQSALDEAGL
jgi:uncharacterized protein with FMN-binding domain